MLQATVLLCPAVRTEYQPSQGIRLAQRINAAGRSPHHLEAYDDSVAHRVLEKVKIIDGEHLLVTFKDGIEVEQVF